MITRAIALIGALAAAWPALADDKGDIEAQLAAFETAFNAGDAAALGAIYSEDAMILPPGGDIVEGREAAQALWQGALDDGFKDLALKPIEVVVVGDAAWDAGTFSGVVAGDGGDAPVAGKYLAVWQKDAGGHWLIHRDIWNEEEPAAE